MLYLELRLGFTRRVFSYIYIHINMAVGIQWKWQQLLRINVETMTKTLLNDSKSLRFQKIVSYFFQCLSVCFIHFTYHGLQKLYLLNYVIFGAQARVQKTRLQYGYISQNGLNSRFRAFQIMSNNVILI